MELDLSIEDAKFRDEVREFLDQSLTEHIKQCSASSPGVFDEPEIALEWQKILHQKGWLVYYWPEEYGGLGWSPIRKYIFERECALAGTPALSPLGLKLLGPVICEFGTKEQKDRILPRIQTAEDYWCQGFSEPGSGSDLASLSTKAVIQDGKYVINGSKIWQTHAHHADKIFCLVRTSQEDRPQKGISFLMIDMEQPGVSVRPILSMSGEHEVNQVFFDNAEADLENLVGEEGQGWAIAKFLLENERGGTYFGPRALTNLEKIWAQAEKTPNGSAGMMSDDKDFQDAWKRVKLVAQGLETTELRILSELADGNPPGPNTSIMKLIGSNLRQDMDKLALSLAGYHGLNLETSRPLYGNSRPELVDDEFSQLAAPRYLNSRAWTIFGGSNEVQRTIIAKTVLGL